MTPSKYSPEDFVANLKNNDFTQKFSFEGMIKLSEKEKSEILFTPGQKCGKWISIPFTLIHEIEYLSNVECHDHNHPFVRVFFNEVEKGNFHARVFLEMLQKLQTTNQLSNGSQKSLAPNYVLDEYLPELGEGNNFRINDGGNSQCNCVSWQRVCVPKRRCHRIRTRNGGWTTICNDYEVCGEFCAQMDCWDGNGGLP